MQSETYFTEEKFPRCAERQTAFHFRQRQSIIKSVIDIQSQITQINENNWIAFIMP